MSRTLRRWYPGAFYHIMHRGIRRKEIFTSGDEFRMFQRYLRASMEKHHCKIHAYCLMTNHFHLLLETSDVPVGAFMQKLSQSYAQFYNSKHQYVGHLFQGRYTSCLIQDDRYFLQTSRYIHLNPVKAQIVRKPEEYIWSSYRSYMGLDDDKITTLTRTLSFFPEPRRSQYRAFVNNSDQTFIESEQEIHLEIEKDEIWLPQQNFPLM